MEEIYEAEPLFISYLKWHYGKGLKELTGVASNFLWFVSHFFSFKLLSKTLFVPWKRMTESYGKGIDLGVYASAFIVNTLMRLVGFCAKTIVLVVGLLAYLVCSLFYFFVFIMWIFAPVLLIGCLVISATFFIV